MNTYSKQKKTQFFCSAEVQPIRRKKQSFFRIMVRPLQSQSWCKPNAKELVQFAEAQPKLCNLDGVKCST